VLTIQSTGNNLKNKEKEKDSGPKQRTLFGMLPPSNGTKVAKKKTSSPLASDASQETQETEMDSETQMSDVTMTDASQIIAEAREDDWEETQLVDESQ